MQSKKSEIWVGIFMIMALLAALFLALRVADLKSMGTEPTWNHHPANLDRRTGFETANIVKGGVELPRRLGAHRL